MFAQSVCPKDRAHNLIKGDLGSMQGCQVKEIPVVKNRLRHALLSSWLDQVLIFTHKRLWALQASHSEPVAALASPPSSHRLWPVPISDMWGGRLPTASSVPGYDVATTQPREAVRMTIIRIGLDTSKHVFQTHGVDEKEQPVLRRQLRRSCGCSSSAANLPSATRGAGASVDCAAPEWRISSIDAALDARLGFGHPGRGDVRDRRSLPATAWHCACR
jgi:hypothetical protein